jgi:hypothetical protein
MHDIAYAKDPPPIPTNNIFRIFSRPAFSERAIQKERLVNKLYGHDQYFG